MKTYLVHTGPFLFWMVALVFLPLLQLSAQNELDKPIQKRIDRLFKDFDIATSPGYAIGIVKGEQLIYGKGYGSANLDYEIPIGTHSMFSIASVSKQFTGAAIALLIMEGKIDLEMSAKDFYPALEKYPQNIQLKHLIYNCSGITDYYRMHRKDGKSWLTLYHFDIEECLSTALSPDTLLFDPGEKWDYSNINWMLLTKVVEKVSRMRFDEFVEKKLFQPLGMKQSLIHTDITQIIPNRVMPYNVRNKDYIEAYKETGIYVAEKGEFIQHPRISPHYGGSGVMSSIEDLAKWCINFHTKAFGGEEFYQLMLEPQAFPHGRNNQAFGLYLGDFNGKKIAAWDGGDYGISSMIKYFLDEKIAIICLSNLGSGEAYRKIDQIADILVEEGVF
ncbi:MAG: serine hydrolase [Bacteroidota bacterium]